MKLPSYLSFMIVKDGKMGNLIIIYILYITTTIIIINTRGSSGSGFGIVLGRPQIIEHACRHFSLSYSWAF